MISEKFDWKIATAMAAVTVILMGSLRVFLEQRHIWPPTNGAYLYFVTGISCLMFLSSIYIVFRKQSFSRPIVEASSNNRDIIALLAWVFLGFISGYWFVKSLEVLFGL